MRKFKRETSSTALAVIEHTGTEIALPDALLGKAKNYASKSRSEKTLRDYAKQWKKFQRWANKNGRESLPAGVETLAGYMTWMAEGQDDGKAMSVSSIDSAMSAIRFRHKSKGYFLPTDDPILQNVRAGIRREMALKRTVRRVRPLVAKQLMTILEMLRPENPREARDAAVLAVAFAGALRRSEVVGLDWLELGTYDDAGRLGLLKRENDGMTILLMRSKASQDTAQDVPIPKDYAPILLNAIENWVTVGKVEKGTPLFRGVKGRGWSENTRSPYLGTCWSEAQKKWRAQHKVDGKTKHLGTYDTDYKAHLAYCAAKGIEPQQPDEDSVNAIRMTSQMVAIIVRRRIGQWLQAENRKRGMKKLTPEEMAQQVKEYAGHSLRAGSITSMIEAGRNNHEVKLISRHKSDDMISTYFRPVDKRKNWGLKGVAF